MADVPKPAAAPPPPKRDLRGSILTLGSVNALDMVIQFLLPILLVRCLSNDDFGQYRALWLLASTATAILPLSMAFSLYYFLPRHANRERAAYLAQTTTYMALAGVVGGLFALISPAGAHFDRTGHLMSAIFVAAWVFSSMLDVMCNALQRTRQQAAINLSMSLLRLGLVAGTAYATRSGADVLTAHLVLGGIKALACVIMVAYSAHGEKLDVGSKARWREHIHYALPFGVSTALYGLRSRVDQWVVVSMFSSAAYGIYSVASVFSPIQGLVRSTVTAVLLPELNRLHRDGSQERMLEVNGRGNMAMAVVIFPVLVFIMVAADELIQLLFSAKYLDAANVMRIYALALLMESVEVTTLLTTLRQGKYLMMLDASLMIVTLATSALGAFAFGVTGTALGGVVGSLMAQWLNYVRLRNVQGTPIRQQQPWEQLARMLLAAMLGGLAAVLILHLLDTQHHLVGLLCASVLFTAIYWLALRALGMASTLRGVLGPRVAGLLGF